MAKLVKQTVMLWGGVFLTVVVALLGLFVLWRLFIFGMEYSERFIECDPQQIMVRLERIFDIDFPDEIRGVKAATSRGHWLQSNIISFKVKFTAEPDTVAKFFVSFPRKILFEPYKASSDARGSDLRRTPGWFKKPIQRGKVGAGGVSGRGKNIERIYIDTGNEKNFVVYLRGFYRHDLEN